MQNLKVVGAVVSVRSADFGQVATLQQLMIGGEREEEEICRYFGGALKTSETGKHYEVRILKIVRSETYEMCRSYMLVN